MRINPTHQQWNKLRSAAWLPALLLIMIQIVGGMRDMPQFAFFLLYLQEELGLKPVTISTIVAGGQVAGMITALLGGMVITQLGNKRMLVLGLSFAALGSLTFLVHRPGLVALIWFITGVGSSLVTVGSASFLTRISGQGSLGILAAFYALSMTIGGAIGNPLAGVLIERYGYAAFTSAVLPLTICLILAIALLMQPTDNQTGSPLSIRSLGSGLLSTSRQTNMGLLAGMRCLPTVFYGMLNVLIPLMINSLTGSKVLVAAYGTTNLVVASAAQLLTGRAADRWGARVPTLVAYSVLISAGLGLAASMGTVWGVFAFGVLGIAAAWSLSTLMYIWVSDGVPKSEHPSTFGLLHAVWSLSMISGSVLGGWFVTTMPGLPFLFGGLLNVASLGLTLAFYNRNGMKAAEADNEPLQE